LLLVVLRLRQHTLLAIVVGLWGASDNTLYWVLLLVMLRLRQHTLLAMVVGLWGASDNTLYWVLLLAMRGFGQHILLGIIVGLMWGAFINGFIIILFLNNSRKVEVSISVSPPKLLKQISPHMALLSCFPINLFKRTTIRQISYSQTCTFPQTVRRTGIC
jgi:hypothetical protein